MNRDNTGKYNTDSMGHTYGYDYKGGQDLENTGRAQTTSDGRYQWEETVDVSKDED